MPPLRILVDLIKLLPDGEGGGIKPALLEMLRWLGAQSTQPLEFIYVVNSACRGEVAALVRPADRMLDAAEATPDLAARLDCSLVYCPFGVTDLACPGIPTVTLVVDLLHRDFPTTLPDPDRIYREQIFHAAAKATDRFQVISDYTRKQLAQHYGVSDARMFRTHLPVHHRLPAATASGGPFFFYPANFWLHKNHEVLLEAYALYRRDAGTEAWPLLFTGHPHEARLASLHQNARALGIHDQVIFRGYLSDGELAACYRSAGALVFPSLHEGFGIPLLEAMAAGIPIIASNATALPEVAGPAALLVDATKPAELATAMRQVAGDPALRATLVAAGQKRLADFSADNEFNLLLKSLQEAAARPARWRHSGYFPVDGLTSPLAIFALPAGQGNVTLVLTTKPLHVKRTLQIRCGEQLLRETEIPADQPLSVRLAFRPRARALSLRVPDASSLSASDARVHGILLQTLQITAADGWKHDLLDAEKSAAPFPFVPTAPAAEYLGHIESHLPDELPDGCLEIRGWCIRPDGRPTHLRLRAGELNWPVATNLPRPDVSAAHPALRDNACGFVVRLRLAPGEYDLILDNDDTPRWKTPLLRHRLEVPRFAALRRVLNPDPQRLIAFQLMADPYHTPRAIRGEKFPRRSILAPKLPRLSVVTPSFQQGAFLGQAMRSVLEQDVEGDYFVQDGGSTDGSAELLARFNPARRPQARQLHFVGWHSARDAGQSDAITKAFARTSGGPDDIMAWINSDDLYLPGALPFVVDYFARHPEVDVVYGNRVLVDEASREIGRWFLPRHDDEVLRLNDFVPQETLFWRRRVWTAAGGLDPAMHFAMDWDLLLRFQAAGARMVHLPYFLGCFRIHASQKTSATMHSTGRLEIEQLRRRTFERDLAVEELLAHPRLRRYLRRSAAIELLDWVGLRID